MNLLFNQVYFNSFIKKQILDHLVHSINYKTINYKYCFDVAWLIRNENYGLLASKLHHHEYLYLDKYRIKDLFKIKDKKLFIQCFEKFRVYYDNHGGIVCGHYQDTEANVNNVQSSVLEFAVEHDNDDAFMYLFDRQYQFTGSLLLELLCTKGKLDLIRYIATSMKEIPNQYVSVECFLKAVKCQDKELVALLFQLFGEFFSSQSLENREKILIESLDYGGLEIFNLVQKYFQESIFLFSLRKGLIYNKTMLWTLYLCTLKSYKTFTYLLDHFDLSFTQIEQEPDFFISPHIVASSFGDSLVVKHMLETNKSLQQDIDPMCFNALVEAHFEMYSMIKTHYNSPLVPLPRFFKIGCMKEKSLTCENVKYLVETLKADISREDLERSGPFEVFKYLFLHHQNIKSGLESNGLNDYTFVNSVIDRAYKQSNIDYIVLLHKQGVSLKENHVWSRDLELFGNLDKRVAQHFLKTLISICPPSVDDLETLVKALEYFCRHSDNVNIIKLLYGQVIAISGDSDTDTRPSLSHAAQGGRFQTLLFLFNKNLKPNNYYELLEAAARGGSITVMKYIFEKYAFHLSNIQSHPKILENAIMYNHLNCVEYLVPLYPKLDNLSYQVLRNINDTGNLMMAKFLFESMRFNKKIITVLNLCLQKFDK
ncbi:hypothetical protein CYY_009405 [Polysphondylium violaceum]|uniref:Ankyrin repeat-containing protein n=1 Tax=Polysphondylium violaceum TaxID=133409 RepID=A0A8J4PLP9_9MYCE|nr:hypothetical protein CYY_009405 [Polysphondylium violaceum]